jgi:hypothetical protein
LGIGSSRLSRTATNLFFVNNYANNRRLQSHDDDDFVRQFFEHYPQGLKQEDEILMDGLPLHKILFGHNECNTELIRWMAEQYPDSMVHKTIRGGTPLSRACTALDDANSTNMAEICKFLIRRCTQSVRIATDRSGLLPVHLLGWKCHSREVQEIALLLLREYPESYTMISVSETWRLVAINSVPFFQRVKPILDQEIELKVYMGLIKDVPQNLNDAVLCSNNPLLTHLPNIFKSWAAEHLKVMETKMELISTQIEEIRNEFEE